MIDFTTLTLVDYGIVLAFVLSATMSILRGLTREILGLAGWVVSIIIANYSAPLIENPIVDLLQVKGLGAALAWGLPFAASVVVWFILASLIAPGLKRVGLGSLDRWLGVLFGFVRGYGLVLIVFVAAVFAAEGEGNLPKTVKKSHSTPILSRSAHYFSEFVPRDYRKQLLDYLSYRAPVTTSDLTLDQELATVGTGKIDAPLDEPSKANKKNFSDRMKLLNDEKAR
ncbi:MAG: CvpA family protein [Candidatus Puniceispirillaceae bacterium]